MTTVVTGASGHIGANLVRTLLAEDRDVKGIVRTDTRALKGLKIEIVKTDIRDLDMLIRGFEGAKIVYHLAAVISITGPQGGLVHDVNVNGVRNVVSACLECGVKRLVHFSSVHAFQQQPLDEPIVESRALVGEEAIAYDRSKALGLLEVMKGVEKGLNAVIIHPSGVIGPYDFKPSRMGTVLLDLFHQKFRALVNGGFNWVDVRDVVNGAIAIEKKGRTGENFILSGHWVSFKELADIVGEVTGKKIPHWISPMWLARFGAPIAQKIAELKRKDPLFTSESLLALRANHKMSHAKATKEIDYSPRPIRITIKDTYKWFINKKVDEFPQLDITHF
ncbi:MAG: NAD-dependent epimerase/dehydratase family protein [Candidatus Hermodarchaeota archaeon]